MRDREQSRLGQNRQIGSKLPFEPVQKKTSHQHFFTDRYATPGNRQQEPQVHHKIAL
jgi:hypothetical protein